MSNSSQPRPPRLDAHPTAALIDVSPPLSPSTAVWAGDEPLRIHWSQRLAARQTSNLSAITLTPHLGAHADAPLHLFDGGIDAAAMNLLPFIGPAVVVDLTGAGAISASHLQALALEGEERLLLKTRAPGVSVEQARDEPRGAHLTLDAAEFLIEAGILLVGIDTLSVDDLGDPQLRVHRRLLSVGTALLEGLDLSAAAAGRYELIALPLRLVGVEASPVRAVLRPLPAASR
jgi:arylformamidase